jgi:hypothetical protein
VQNRSTGVAEQGRTNKNFGFFNASASTAAVICLRNSAVDEGMDARFCTTPPSRRRNNTPVLASRMSRGYQSYIFIPFRTVTST